MKLPALIAILVAVAGCTPGDNSTDINGDQLSAIPTYTYGGR